MKLGVIGVGNMATAILSGVLRTEIIAPSDICILDANPDKTKPLEDLGVQACSDIATLAQHCPYLLLAVKPQNIDDILPQIKPYVQDTTVIISILAGVSAAYIQKSMGMPCKVVQVMPNTPLLIGCGTTAISAVPPTTPQDLAFVKSLFAAAGEATEIDNSLMNEVIPLNGSSPAYIYLFAKLFIQDAVKRGFDHAVAKTMFCNTLIGSARMMLESDKSLQELIDMVTSPGGTTFKGLEAFKEHNFADTIDAVCEATIQRAYELGK